LNSIAKDEVDLLAEFLLDGNMDVELDLIDYWQNYENMKEDYDNGNLIECYDFYNDKKGTGIYMQLPNIRGEKEDFDRSLYSGSKLEDWAAERKKS
jgi:hypothetical protein